MRCGLIFIFRGFTGGSAVKNSLDNAETWVWSLVQEDPPEKEIATLSSILAGKSHGQRTLAGYRPWSDKELEMTEQLSIHGMGEMNILDFLIWYIKDVPSHQRTPAKMCIMKLIFRKRIFSWVGGENAIKDSIRTIAEVWRRTKFLIIFDNMFV